MNRCVGCHACVIACQIENYSVQSEPWRNISTFNTFQHPLLPLYHFSLACNHCEIPLCLEQCPSRAYSKNVSLQTIDHDADRCIGCRYCSWVCPYDAPKFIRARGVVEKCTLCKTRIEDGLKPNCVNLCPTGALEFGDIDDEPISAIPGSVDKGLRPGLKIIPLRKVQSRPRSYATPIANEAESRHLKMIARNGKSKVSPSQEWPLVVFTILTSILFGAMSASLYKPMDIDPIAFLAAGIFGMVLSTLHLGKKGKAWRAVINWRSSWLSREVGAYLIFLLLCGASFLLNSTAFLKAVAVLAGIVTLFSMDMVYAVAERKPMPGAHSGSVLVTGLLFMSVFSGLLWLFVIVATWKFFLYGLEFVRPASRPPLRMAISIIRIAAGFMLPLLYLGSSTGRNMAILLVIVAEVINRAEFYVDLDIATPLRHISSDLLEELARSPV